MRIIAWNIRAGGGARAEAIADALRVWAPDVAVLSEFRATPPSRRIAAALACAGLTEQRASTAPWKPARNALLVASRWPLRRLPRSCAATPAERWLAVSVAAPEPFVLGAVHVPCRVSGQKRAFCGEVVEAARRFRKRPALIVGDTNSGLPGVDEENPCFGPAEVAFFAALESAGYRDAFRVLHPSAREYTWFSPNAGNGFRLDQGFVSAPLLRRLAKVEMSWAPPGGHAHSDHAALCLDFDAALR